MSRRKAKQQGPVKDLLQSIIDVFSANSHSSFNYKQIASRLGVTSSEERQAINAALTQFETEGVLELVSPGKYKYHKKPMIVVGTVDMTAHGYAFVTSPDAPDDIFIAAHNLHQALHGDTVRVQVFTTKRGRMEGEVEEVVERGQKTYVGRIELTNHYGFVVSDNRHMPYDIFIPADKLMGAKDGQKVLAEIVEWTSKSRNPVGQIIDVLGNAGENDVEMHSILAEFGLPYRFPESIDKVAKRISDKITTEDYAERRDFRDITTFTIDPLDAKDFDDALSIRPLEKGGWEVGVHIADVTHYCKPDTVIDREAAERATSVYLVDRTIPMLPERLSNFVCSLRPNEEKLCFSAVFELDDKGMIRKEWFGRTVIYSNRRFTYEEAQQILDTEVGDYAEELKELNRLAGHIRAQRFKNGAISFERDEAKIEVDKDGKPLRVYFKQPTQATQLIEEFMLLANKKVAELIGQVPKGKKAKTFVYRIHDKPNEEKFNNFRQFIKRFGYDLTAKTEKSIPKELNKLLATVHDKPEGNLIETLAIRSMAKATYSTDNVGHYGLAFPYYTHFTSPIRRYPDMMVHRLLAQYLAGKKSANKAQYEEFCKHSSLMEQKAAQAERASIKYKMVEFMQDKVGQEFDGLISGCTEWGMYVELIENKIEGMVSLRSMKDDFYSFDAENYCLVGRNYNRRYTLGDQVRIKVTGTDLEQKHLDFMLVTNEDESVERSLFIRDVTGGKDRNKENSGQQTNKQFKKNSPKRKSNNQQSNTKNKGKKRR